MLRTSEDAAELVMAGARHTVGYVAAFPAPRSERVSPGHLVAVARVADGADVIVWRWYDAVVLDVENGLVRLWEPAHGEVVARPRSADQVWLPGTRAYLSAGLPGADWWVAGPVVARAEDADVELAEVASFCAEHGLL